jgi:hypothetical protein
MMRKIRTFIGILYPNFRRIGIHRTRTRTRTQKTATFEVHFVYNAI